MTDTSHVEHGNGVYILMTRSRVMGGIDYRVAAIDGVERLFWDTRRQQYGDTMNPEMALELFGASKVFTTAAVAWQHARDLHAEKTSDPEIGGDYNLKPLNHSGEVFPTAKAA